MYCALDETDSRDTNEIEKNAANDPELIEYNKRGPVNESTSSNILTREQIGINSYVIIWQSFVCNTRFSFWNIEIEIKSS